MKKFARSQVEYLVRRLEHEKSLSVEIVRTRAMNEYSVSAYSVLSETTSERSEHDTHIINTQLSPDQTDTLVPIRTALNPYNPGTEMRFYNVKDVQARKHGRL